MKKIIFVRHAKAVEPSAEITDSERSLKAKGLSDAHKTAKKLLVFNIRPDLILTSPAFRALETAIVFADELNFSKKKIHLSESLYFDYTTNDFVEMIQKQSNRHNTILVCAHNPKISEIVAGFAAEFHDQLPTCGVAVIDFSIKKWKKINVREGKLSLYIFPEKDSEDEPVKKEKAKEKNKTTATGKAKPGSKPKSKTAVKPKNKKAETEKRTRKVQ